MPGGRVCPPISAVRAVPTDGPPPAFIAALNAVVKSVWAVMAIESARCSVPVNIPGPSAPGADPNPVIEAAGHIPISPLTIVGPVLVTEGVAPKIPKLQAAPKAIPAGGRHTGEVVNVHTKLAASGMPPVSCAPVVIVAVYSALGARVAEGVKVAIMVATT